MFIQVVGVIIILAVIGVIIDQLTCSAPSSQIGYTYDDGDSLPAIVVKGFPTHVSGISCDTSSGFIGTTITATCENSDSYTFSGCSSCADVTCPDATDECKLAGTCQPDGSCSPETNITGKSCSSNNTNQGACMNGVCRDVVWSISDTGEDCYSSCAKKTINGKTLSAPPFKLRDIFDADAGETIEEKISDILTEDMGDGYACGSFNRDLVAISWINMSPFMTLDGTQSHCYIHDDLDKMISGEGAHGQGFGDAARVCRCIEPAVPCAENEMVLSNSCISCPAGTVRPAGDDAGQADTMCEPDICRVDQRVESHACIACPAGTNRAPGDITSGADTECNDMGVSRCSQVVCPEAVHECKIGGVCDEETGQCLPETSAENGIPCNDQNDRTGSDHCLSGYCVGTRLPGWELGEPTLSCSEVCQAVGQTCDGGATVGDLYEPGSVHEPARGTTEGAGPNLISGMNAILATVPGGFVCGGDTNGDIQGQMDAGPYVNMGYRNELRPYEGEAQPDMSKCYAPTGPSSTPIMCDSRFPTPFQVTIPTAASTWERDNIQNTEWPLLKRLCKCV